MTITFDPRAQARKELNAARLLVQPAKRGWFARILGR